MNLDQALETLQGVFIDEVPGADDVLLQGLGQQTGLQMNPAQKKAIVAYGNAKVKRAFQRSTTTPGQRVLMAKADQLSEQSRKEIFSGKAEFIEREYYLRRKYVGNGDGIQRLIEAADEKQTGIQNFNGEKLSENEDNVITAIKLAYGFSTANPAPSPDNVAYVNGQDAETGGTVPLAIPANFLNGEIEISVAGKPVYEGSIKRFFREGLSVGTGVEGGSDAVQLKRPLLVRRGETIQVSLRGAKGGAIVQSATSNHYVEVKFFTDAIKTK